MQLYGQSNYMKLIWLLIVFICGALLPFQGGLNARLGKSIESPLYSSMICFIVGAVAMALYIPFTKESLSITSLKSASIYSILGGGITGAIFITGTMLAIPRIGIAVTFGLVVAGQVIVAVALDHFGILVPQPHGFNLWRLLGIALIILGVGIVQKF